MRVKSTTVLQSRRALSVLTASLGAGAVVVPLYASQALCLRQFAASVGVSIVIACSAAFLGGLLGFLFGIPRTLQQDGRSSDQPNAKSGPDGDVREPATTYAPNTNLEQISDWLTKILVGVGLTQIAAVGDALKSYAAYVKDGLGGFVNAEVFSIALLLFYLTDGFLIGFLWTRLHLAGALKEADAQGRLQAVELELAAIDTDGNAWGLVQDVLNSPEGPSAYTQEEINTTIAPATSRMKAQIFWAAAQCRSKNWRDPQTKHEMRRVIPVFRALIASDTARKYHANHGQLGFALKDQPEPKWAEADAELTIAITMRGPWQKTQWLPHYELARAICRIHLDPAFQTRGHSDRKTVETILADLRVVSEHPAIRKFAEDDADIGAWLKANNLTTKDWQAQAP